MFKSLNRNNADDEVQDIHNDVSQLADSLEGIIKSWASDDKDEIEAKIVAFLKERNLKVAHYE